MKDFENMSIEDLLKELNSMEGVEARVEFLEGDFDKEPKIITSKDIRLELERIMILIEEQKEYEIAIDKLKELYSLFEDLEWGILTFDLDWD